MEGGLSIFGFKSNAKQETPPDYDPYNHASDLLRAAAPYLSPEMHGSLNLFIKTFEFMHAVKEFQTPRHKAEYFKRQSAIDFEGLLRSIRPHCSNEEAGMIDLFLNMLSAANFYKTYQQMASMFAASSAAANPEAGNPAEGAYDENARHPGSSPDMMDALLEMLPPEQKSTFETLKVLMESGMLNQMFSPETP